MLVGVYQTAATLLFALAFYAVDFRLMARYDRQRRAAGSGRSWDYTIMVMLMFGVLALQPVLLPWMGVQVPGPWGWLIQVAGAALILGGLALQTWARLHLRQFYAERVELQPGHYLVDSGPYAYVRHPLFTSFFMCVIGLLLVNPALPTALVTLYVFWDFPRAARQEEELLSQNVPGYTEYMAHTPRFLPSLRRRAGGE